MQLTVEQQAQVAAWVREGASLSDVQKRLAEELSISMTYMDVRFLVDDLDLTLADKGPAQPTPDLSKSPEEQADAAASGTVSVDIDRVVRPGAVVSGNVTFSDGTKAEWYLDQMGRLGLAGVSESYQPSPDDLAEFQAQLQKALQSRGF